MTNEVIALSSVTVMEEGSSFDYRKGHNHIVGIWKQCDGVGPMGFYDMIYVMHASEDTACYPAHNCLCWVTDTEVNRQMEEE